MTLHEPARSVDSASPMVVTHRLFSLLLNNYYAHYIYARLICSKQTMPGGRVQPVAYKAPPGSQIAIQAEYRTPAQSPLLLPALANMQLIQTKPEMVVVSAQIRSSQTILAPINSPLPPNTKIAPIQRSPAAPIECPLSGPLPAELAELREKINAVLSREVEAQEADGDHSETEDGEEEHSPRNSFEATR